MLPHRPRILLAATVLLTAALIGLLPSFSRAQGCIDYTEYVHLIGGVYLGAAGPYGGADVALEGDYAYVPMAEILAIVRIADPTDPNVVGQVAAPARIRRVDVQGDYAYAVSVEGLHVVDVSVPSAPVVVGGVATEQWPVDVEVGGDYAYVSQLEYHALPRGVDVIDVSDPTSPAIVATIEDYSIHGRLFLHGNYLLACGDVMFTIIDVSNPRGPFIAGGERYLAYSDDIAAQGQYVYVLAVSDWTDGLHVFDVTDVAHPVLVTWLPIPAPLPPEGLDVEGDRAFVRDFISLHVVDISEPSRPSLLGTTNHGIGYEVAARDGIAFVPSNGMDAGWNTLQIVDTTPGRSVAPVGAFVTPEAEDVAVQGAYAYLVDRRGEFRVLDVTEPSHPTLRGLANVGWAWGVAVQGGYAYVAASASGLQVLDVSAPSRPVVVGQASCPGPVLGVAVAGDRAYAAQSGVGLAIVDVSTPESPVILGTVDTPGSAQAVALEGAMAVVADGNAGIQVIDVSDPGAPSIIGSVATPGYSGDVAVAGGLAYTANGAIGLHVIDLSDPAAPVLVGTVFTPNARGVAVRGPYAYVADDIGCVVVDVSDPFSPFIIGQGSMEGRPRRLEVAGDHLFAAAGFRGLQIVPAQCDIPVAVEVYGLSAEWRGEEAMLAWSVHRGAQFLGFHVHRSPGGTDRFERLTAAPVVGTSYVDVGLMRGRAYAYLLEGVRPSGASEMFGPATLTAGWTAGGVAELLVAESAPNPFRAGGEVAIGYTLPSATRVTLCIFDVRGRMVRELMNGPRDAGAGVVTWDGADDRGRPVPAGIYHYRLMAGERSLTRRLVMIP